MRFLKELEALLHDRRKNMPEGSYTTKLFREGEDRILKKIGEEAGEVIIAAKNKDKPEIIHESSDLIYHLLVLLVHEGITLDDISAELEKRHKKN